jgi:hypothetical protein
MRFNDIAFSEWLKLGCAVFLLLLLFVLVFSVTGCKTCDPVVPCPPPPAADVVHDEVWSCPEPPTFPRVPLPKAAPFPDCDILRPQCMAAVNRWLVDNKDLIVIREGILQDEIAAREAALDKYRRE